MNVINQYQGEGYVLYNGDNCEVIKGIPDKSIGFSIFSPPFSSLYVFSDSDRDMSNSKNLRTFLRHFNFLVKELNRVMQDGRLIAVHCMDLTTNINREGFLSVVDFRGMIIKLFQRNGFYYHNEVTIWKNPVVEVTRTKNIQLLYKQFCKDASISRTSLPDRLLVFRKAGVNENPIVHDKEEFTPNDWGKLASPVWMDIKQTNVLNSQKEDGDEKHISCLQLDVIERALKLWSNKGDIVFDPFMGVGSVAYEAIKLNRKSIGIELKESYFNQSIRNVQEAENEKRQMSMLDIL